MGPSHYLLFAAFACLLLSFLALAGERRRTRRLVADAVGWMPWRGLSLLLLFAAVALGMLAIRS